MLAIVVFACPPLLCFAPALRDNQTSPGAHCEHINYVLFPQAFQEGLIALHLLAYFKNASHVVGGCYHGTPPPTPE